MGGSGNITTFIDFQDSILSETANQRFIGRFPSGIYYGADLTIVNNTTVAVSNFDIEFYDGTSRIKATSSASNNVTVSTVNVWVVARWSYTGTSNDVPTLLGVSSVATNDIILGQCVYSGSTLNGFSLTSRSDAFTFNKFLQVEPTGTASWGFKVRAGNVASSTTTFFVPEQIITYPYTAPVSNPRIDVVGVNSTGAISVIQGTEGASPVAPAFGGSVPLAQILLQTSSTTITSSMITDVRAYLAFAASSVPAGCLFPFGGSSVPSGYYLCNGQAVSRTGNAALFTAIGTTYGPGNGSTTFNVPNLQGNVPVGFSASDANFSTLGQTGGEDTHTLVIGEITPHAHPVTDPGHAHGVTDPSHIHGEQGYANQGGSQNTLRYSDTPTNGSTPSGNVTLPAVTGVSVNSNVTGISIGNTGGGGAHNNLQPYIVVNYIIKY